MGILEEYFSFVVRPKKVKEALREEVKKYDAFWLLPSDVRESAYEAAAYVPSMRGVLGPLNADGGLYSRGARGIVGVAFYDNPRIESWRLGFPPFYFAVMRLELYNEYAEELYAEVAEALGAENIVITHDARVFVVEWWRGGADTWGLWRPVLPRARRGDGES